MASRDSGRVEVLQGTLDLIVLRALSTRGPQHAYALAARLEQSRVAVSSLCNAALVRLDQRGWIKGKWQRTEAGRDAKYYAITAAGARALAKQTERWRRLVGFLDKLLLDER